MRAADLRLDRLLDFRPEGGLLRFAGQRAVLLDVAALGLLREELIETLGLDAARGVLSRFGYAHGWRTAEVLQEAFTWDDPAEWRRAGGRLHTLQGLVVVEGLAGQGEPGRAFAEALWHESYEAEQHLLQRGQAETPVCWSLVGFASGYLSRTNQREIYCLETRCVARGDAVCSFEARPREEWGEAIEGHLPYYDRDCLDLALKRTRDALRRARRKLRATQLEGPGELPELDPGGVVARSPAMRSLVELARRAAPVDTTVLISGESGVGKERVARLIHQESSRLGGPFLAVNCAAIAPALLESELFGHARGAFTGASGERLGLFEAAKGGTLFLDEVGELPLATQASLLRVLQEREVRRVGENVARPIDVRLVAATNRELGREVAQGRFREDLYYRLKVVELTIPPLRERPEDLLPLAQALLGEIAGRLGRPVEGLTPAAADALTRHTWPGNVRELGNALERALVVSGGGRLEPADLPPDVRQPLRPSPAVSAAPLGGGRTLAEVERAHIEAVLAEQGGDRLRAAAALGIGIATLYRRLRQWRDEGEG